MLHYQQQNKQISWYLVRNGGMLAREMARVGVPLTLLRSVLIENDLPTQRIALFSLGTMAVYPSCRLVIFISTFLLFFLFAMTILFYLFLFLILLFYLILFSLFCFLYLVFLCFILFRLVLSYFNAILYLIRSGSSCHKLGIKSYQLSCNYCCILFDVFYNILLQYLPIPT